MTCLAASVCRRRWFEGMVMVSMDGHSLEDKQMLQGMSLLLR
jgi:hypothetical protein